jgi:septal ring factor EnvC (AmiA/AmiB activator)
VKLIAQISPKDSRMSRFPFIAAGLAILALGVVVLLVAVVQDQRHLRSVQRELDQAKEQVIRSKATADDLEKSAAKLKKELDETNKARTQLQGNLDEANSTIEQLRKEQLFFSSLATLASSMPARAHNLTSSRNGIVAHYVRFQFEFIEAMF